MPAAPASDLAVGEDHSSFFVRHQEHRDAGGTGQDRRAAHLLDDEPRREPVRRRSVEATAPLLQLLQLDPDRNESGVRNMVRAGVSETVAMKISGHRTSSMFRRYNITSDEDLRAVAERMGMSSGITEPGPAKTRLVSMRSS